jgi:hypothetical protein
MRRSCSPSALRSFARSSGAGKIVGRGTGKRRAPRKTGKTPARSPGYEVHFRLVDSGWHTEPCLFPSIEEAVQFAELKRSSSEEGASHPRSRRGRVAEVRIVATA